MVANNWCNKVMRIPFKIYPLGDIYSSLNDLVKKYMYCPNCLSKTVVMKEKTTLLSSIRLDVDDVVYICECCNKRVDPMTLKEVREEKINRISK